MSWDLKKANQRARRRRKDSIPHSRNYTGHWYKISGQLRTSVHYDWSMVFKATINQSQVTLVNPNDPRDRCTESLSHSSNSFWSEEFQPYLLLLLFFLFQVVNCLCQLGSTVSISGVFGRCGSTGSEAVLTL